MDEAESEAHQRRPEGKRAERQGVPDVAVENGKSGQRTRRKVRSFA